MARWARHGECRIIEVDSIPVSATQIVADGVFARGTVTGNVHRATGLNVRVLMCTESGRVFISAEDGVAIITHAEHGERELPFRFSEVRPKREYDHFLEESRAVSD
jgi:hypothetical protein